MDQNIILKQISNQGLVMVAKNSTFFDVDIYDKNMNL